MKNVSKKTQAEIIAAQSKYADARNDVNDTLANGKEQIESLISQVVSDVNLKVGKLNDAIATLNALRDDVASEIEAFIEEKSEAWRDGDRGSAYSEWYEAWTNEIEDLDEMDIPSIDDVFSEFEGALDEKPECGLDENDYPTEPAV